MHENKLKQYHKIYQEFLDYKKAHPREPVLDAYMVVGENNYLSESRVRHIVSYMSKNGHSSGK
jgi:hypothetical protein